METRELTFLAMNSMSDKRLHVLQTKYLPSSEQYKMINYELAIRSIELPKEWKLNS